MVQYARPMGLPPPGAWAGQPGLQGLVAAGGAKTGGSTARQWPRNATLDRLGAFKPGPWPVAKANDKMVCYYYLLGD
jgi:hypothetical protein